VVVFSAPVAERGESVAGESLVMLLITIRFSCLTTAGNQAMDDAMNYMDYFASGFLEGKGKAAEGAAVQNSDAVSGALGDPRGFGLRRPPPPFQGTQ
jgi:hypothetical protein